MKYGLIGEKLGHSFSPHIHALIGSYPYELKELAPGELEGFLKRKDFLGINVTIPYKQAVMPYLDEIDPLAQTIGAVNTVVNRNGRLIGYNTDAFGMEYMVKSAGIDPKGKKVLIGGTGGTSLTAMAVMEAMGAGVVHRLSRGEKPDALTYEAAKHLHPDADIFINTTPVGMYPHGEGMPIDPEDYPGLSGVVDVVYNPLTTTLVRAAKKRGIPSVNGLIMLVAQAVRASELFFETSYPQNTVKDIYETIYGEKKSLYLIGMPSSGKSTVGKLVANALGRPFVDLDAMIVEQEGMDIPTIFQEKGEGYFREAEHKALLTAVQNCGGSVVATGGGTPLRADNRLLMQEDGTVFFLDRDLDKLTPTVDRPTASDREAMANRYRERRPIYLAAGTHRIDGNGTPLQVAELVIKEFAT